MRLLILATLAAVSLAAPQGYGYPQPEQDSVESEEVYAAPATPVRSYSAPRAVDSVEFIPTLRDERNMEEDGTYSVDVETGNGIVLAQSGDSYGNKQGSISFTHPDGTPFYMTYVADENGFQPQSDALPVAPAFPHPIPEFVLRQIEFARQEDEAAARAAASSPSARYAAPASSEETYRYKRDLSYAAPAARRFDSAESAEIIPILRQTSVHEEDGTHNFEFETANGISVSESGDDEGNKQGVISFTHPDGTPFYMTFVADENGFQPQSDALPVAPAFPHPIPEFVLRQIEFARQEDEAAARAAASSPSARYAAPASSEEDYRYKRDLSYAAPAARRFDSAESAEIIPILRQTSVHEEDGTHNFEFETANGISVSEAGDDEGNKQGVISFTHPDGTPFYMTFVADENGFQPQSDALPVAPAFPHPIPEFVLRQIEFARLEDEAAARAAASSPSARYAAPATSEETYSPPRSRYSAPSSSEEN